MKKINDLVSGILDKYKISEPPIDIESIAKHLNIIVVKRPYASKDNLSGMLVRDQGREIIAINASHNIEKQRFSIAHEIGHSLLHKGENLIVDPEVQNFKVNLRNQKSSSGKDKNEIEANEFASQLLMPDKFLIDDLKSYGKDVINPDDLEEIAKKLSRKYKVSLISMRLRIYSFLR